MTARALQQALATDAELVQLRELRRVAFEGMQASRDLLAERKARKSFLDLQEQIIERELEIASDFEAGVRKNGIVIAFPGPDRVLGPGELPTRPALTRAWRERKMSTAWIGPFSGTAAGVLGATMISLDANQQAWKVHGTDRDFYVQFDATEAWDVLRALSEIAAAKPKTYPHAVRAMDTLLYAATLSGRKPSGRS